MKINAGGQVLEGKLDTHSDFKVPDGSSLPRSVLKLDVTVDDATPQPLKKLRTFPGMVLQIQGSWPNQAQIVLQSVFSCFAKAGHVSEGLVGDLVWGFAQAGVPAELTVHGLMQLEKLGLVRFQAPDNNYVTLHDTAAEKAWVRYQRPLLELIYES